MPDKYVKLRSIAIAVLISWRAYIDSTELAVSSDCIGAGLVSYSSVKILLVRGELLFWYEARHRGDSPNNDVFAPERNQKNLVPEARLELAQGCPYRILSPARLPFHHSGTGE